MGIVNTAWFPLIAGIAFDCELLPTVWSYPRPDSALTWESPADGREETDNGFIATDCKVSLQSVYSRDWHHRLSDSSLMGGHTLSRNR